MKLRLNSITSTVCAALLLLAAPVLATDYTWDGNGDANNSGNWSDALYWDVGGSYPDDGSDTATLPAPGAARIITVDVPTYVHQVTMANSPNSTLRLNADLTVSNFTGTAWQSTVRINGNTFTIHQGGGTYLPAVIGTGGQFIKVGPGTSYSPNSASGYSGDFIISNGTFIIGGGVTGNGTSSNMTVYDGATVQLNNTTATALPSHMYLHGDGGTGDGAIRNATSPNLYPDITVVSDAMIYNAKNSTLNLLGDIHGASVLTLTGTGNSSCTFTLSGSSSTLSDSLFVTNVSVLLGGDLPNITNITVDAGGVFEGLSSQFPSASVVTQNGGIWNQPTSASWTGLGDGSNWTDTANWSPPVVPTDTATYPVQGSPEIIYVDAPATVATFNMGANANNRLRLGANLTVSNFNGGAWQAYVEPNGYDFTIYAANGTYLPNFTGGGGRFLKLGPGTAYTPNGSSGYSGDYIISNGTFVVGGGVMGQGGSANLTVYSGATVEDRNGGATAFPSHVYINGDGGTGDWAIKNYNKANFYPDITVVTDAMIYNSANTTYQLHGDIDGPGTCLTLKGTGNPLSAFDVAGLGSTYSNKLIVTNCTVNISGHLANITSIWVDAGGVLEGLQSQFPLATVTKTNGGVWNQVLSATWTGLGDGSNWTDTANWSPNIIPIETATINNLGSTPSTRIFVDVASTVETLNIAVNTGNNILRLGATLTVSNFNGGAWQALVEMNGHTLNVYNYTGSYLPNLGGGGGLFVKLGSGDCGVPNNSTGYTGDYLIDDGLFKLYGGALGRGGSTNMTINDGARVRITSNPFGTELLPHHVRINGNGGGLGVLDNDLGTFDCEPDLIVDSTALITTGNGQTMNIEGLISGAGAILTLDGNGGGDYDLSGIGSTYANKLVVTNGTVVISGTFPSVADILVDQGGVLEGLQSQFPSASVVTQNGGIWNQVYSAQWTGLGDGSNWTDTANWSPQIVPTDTATINDLGATPSSRVFVDAPATVSTLVLQGIASVRVRLGANLTITNLNAHWQPYFEMNGYILTVHQRSASQTYIPALTGGGGQLIKVSSGTIYSPNTSTGYSGDFIISNGLFVVGGGVLGQGGSSNLTVYSGATLQLNNVNTYALPSHAYLHGNGVTANGAIRNVTSDNLYPDITAVSDALIFNAKASTLTFPGDISGPGVLTLTTTSGDFDLDGTYNLAISGASANSIIADQGDVNISDATLDVSGESGASELEYVVIDHSPGGTVTGEFVATNNLDVGWEIEYAGTVSNPNAIVLVKTASDATTVIKFQ